MQKEREKANEQRDEAPKKKQRDQDPSPGSNDHNSTGETTSGKNVVQKHPENKQSVSGQTGDESIHFEEEHHFEQEVDYDALSKNELLKLMKKYASSGYPLKCNKTVQEIKDVFERKIEREHKEALQKFIGRGNSEIDFSHRTDPVDKEFFEYYRVFKKNRFEAVKNIKEEKEQNLRAKKEILEEFKKLTENVEVKNGFQRFKELQSQWKKIGHVPKIEVDNLWRSYHFYVNKFYDNLHIYSELKQLDREKNLNAKREICRKLESLEKVSDIKYLKREMEALHEEWRFIGPTPEANYEEILNRFNKAMAGAYARQETLEEEVKKLREKNLQEKQKIIEEIRKFGDFESDIPKEWAQKNRELGQLIRKWKKTGFVPYHKKNEISRQFRDAVRDFNRKKNHFFKEKKRERVANLRRKEEMAKRVEELLELEDLPKGSDEIIQLQKEWKETGPVPPKQSEKIRERFSQLCDEFFRRRSKYFKQRKKSQKENLKAKEALCEEIEKLGENPVDHPLDKIRELRKKWQEIGYVPKKNKDKIQNRFDNALKKILNTSEENLDIHPGLMSYKIKIDGLKVQNKGGRLKSEEKKLVKNIKKNEEEISTLETNIQFFNNSQNAQKLVSDYKSKIRKLKDDTEYLREKFDILKD